MDEVELPRAVTELDVRGACFRSVIADLATTTSPESARTTQRKAVEVVLYALKSFRKAFGALPSDGLHSANLASGQAPTVNGLMYGRVQSGKTNASIATVALASCNGFKCFVVLTSDNTWLGKQTVDRFRLQLGAGDGPIVRSWEDWRSDPDEFVDSVKPYLEDTGLVLVSTKNTKNLENLSTVLKKLGAQRVPGLILDDEADNASLNTNTARKAAGKGGEPSAIFALIGEIRARMPRHVFVQVTATPQSLLLQAIDHPLRPNWVVMVDPGEGYIGGERFFDSESRFIVHVDGDEIGALRAGRINPGKSWDIPDGLAKAVCFFVAAAALRQLKIGSTEVLSMLIHIDHKKVSHQAVKSSVTKYVMWLDKALRSKLTTTERSRAEADVRVAYEELRRTCEDVPSLERILDKLRSSLRNAQPQIIDADNPNRKPDYQPGMNFLIGGNRLGRGVTIEGLAVTYYARDAKTKMMDTVHQHARMFGYRKNLLPITRLFSPEHIVGALKDIYLSDEGTRRVLERDGDINVKPVWVGPRLKPTRANVLNPADLRAIVPGRTIWPTEIIHSPQKVKSLVQQLDERLAKYEDRDSYYEVPIEELMAILRLIPSDRNSARSWDDERVQQVLSAMKAEPIKVETGILNVRRGRVGNEGFRVHREKQYTSGFAEGTQINEAKRSYPEKPILLLRRQCGDKDLGWKDQPFYAPTLIIPESKFAFVFVEAN